MYRAHLAEVESVPALAEVDLDHTREDDKGKEGSKDDPIRA